MTRSQYKRLEFQDIIIFTPLKHNDNRGVFFENLNFVNFKNDLGISFQCVQENVSISKKNVLRGLHFQKGNHAQTKIIHVEKGSIFDVVVDIRTESNTYGKWISYILDDNKNENIIIPHGFAHGFLALEDNTKVSYKVDKSYNKKSECSIIWNDPDLMIDWSVNNPILSKKDSEALSLEKNFNLRNFSIRDS